MTFLAQGAFNKVYSVQSGDKSLIMRVSLPVDPKNKTLSEIATLDWIRRNTTLPVPEVISFQAEREKTPVDFEWILMTKLPGKPLADMWRYMQYAAKEQLVQQIAVYCASVFQKQLRSIGNLFPGSGDQIGRIVSMEFLTGENIRQDVYRGPFQTSREWLVSRLSMHEKKTKSTLKTSEGRKELTREEESDNEDAERALGFIGQLRAQLDRIFPSPTDIPEHTVLFHGDLNGHNILVDEGGKLTGVVDWENVSALPLWKACSYPDFLESPTENDPPDPSRYDPNDGETMYWYDLENYEKTRLRQYFLDEMRRLEPKWIEIFEASQVKRDFDHAIICYDCWVSAYGIKNWLRELETVEDPMNVRSIKEIQDARWAE